MAHSRHSSILSAAVMSLIVTALLPALSFGNGSLPGQTLAAKDDPSATALRKAVQNETLKKITRGPNSAQTDEEVSAGTSPQSPSDEDPIPFIRPQVKTEPAPGEIVSGRSQTHSEPNNDSTDEVNKVPHGDKRPASTTPDVKGTARPSTAPAAGVPASHEHHSSAPSIPADQSLKWLQNGNSRYVKKAYRADGRSQADRDRTVPAQKPHAIVLSCADSRVPTEIVFDQGIGEIFTIRVAGQALDSSVIASIEYALEHLGPKLLVVMGHTKCGAVDAALKIKEGDSAGTESIDKLLANIRPHLKTVMTEKRSSNLEVESALNADGVARDLLQRSELVRKKVESGELTIKPALYWIDSGKVKFY